MNKNKSNKLRNLYPNIAKEWHPRKNKGIVELSSTTFGSNKVVWWLCSSGHEWQARVVNRTKLARGCPYCAGRYATKDNNLQKTHRSLISEWHHIKNTDISPSQLKAGSNKRVWWICNKGHEWQAAVSNRAKLKTGCPYCYGSLAAEDNSLFATHPTLCKEWNFEKNTGMYPTTLKAGSNKKVWWVCARKHEWEAKVSNRSYLQRGCPYCADKRRNKYSNIYKLLSTQI